MGISYTCIMEETRAQGENCWLTQSLTSSHWFVTCSHHDIADNLLTSSHQFVTCSHHGWQIVHLALNNNHSFIQNNIPVASNWSLAFSDLKLINFSVQICQNQILYISPMILHWMTPDQSANLNCSPCYNISCTNILKRALGSKYLV